MATPVNPTERTPESLPPDHEQQRSGPGAWVWVLLVLLLIAAAWYFLGQRNTGPTTPETVTPISETTPLPSESPVSTAPAARERSSVPARPAAVTRDAQARDQPAPDYPAAAQRAGEEGTVIVRVDVDANGKPTDVAVAQSSRSRELDRAALRAVRHWTFEPAMRDGKAIASTVQVPVDFRMERQ